MTTLLITILAPVSAALALTIYAVAWQRRDERKEWVNPDTLLRHLPPDWRDPSPPTEDTRRPWGFDPDCKECGGFGERLLSPLDSPNKYTPCGCFGERVQL